MSGLSSRTIGRRLNARMRTKRLMSLQGVTEGVKSVGANIRHGMMAPRYTNIEELSNRSSISGR